ncbi:hypothetical protein L7F22_038513 [Adiantum nelumboides]|nr:hypothetical protein [Adiantum nelumboides]
MSSSPVDVDTSNKEGFAQGLVQWKENIELVSGEKLATSRQHGGGYDGHDPEGSAKLLLPALASPSLAQVRLRCCSSSSSNPYKFEPSDVLHLAQKACITLTPQEVEDFQPQLQQLVGWFGQLQEVDLDSVLPALRADNLSQRPLRGDVPAPFENRSFKDDS